MPSSQLKEITLWGKGGPNPPKVAMMLEELGLPYKINALHFTEVKQPAYLALNPNGRMPTIEDPNNGDFVLWESGAIVEYLVDRYDTDRKLSFPPGTNESYLAKQWLFFQTTGQAPYYGQAVWFLKLHNEKLPSAIVRYLKEVKRVMGVLELHLNRQKEAFPDAADGPWLVGGRVSYADLSFLSWQEAVRRILGDEEHEGETYSEDEFPVAKAWLERMRVRPAVAAVLQNVMSEGKPGKQ
ncbi:glutathione S-transferase [Podospora conica]|nr:glutathione S-transferase [Schizothecium conicum]